MFPSWKTGDIHMKFSLNRLPWTTSSKRESNPKIDFNLLTPNVNYSGRIAPLTSKLAFYIFIQQI